MSNKLKGIKDINHYLNDWLHNNGFDCYVQFGNDFSFDYLNDIITYAFFIPDSHDKLFLKVCQDCNPHIDKCDNFILSFFHELGHYMTTEDYSDDIWEDYYTLQEECDNLEDITEEELLNYYLYPIELDATKWGCDYIVNNYEKVKEFFENLQKLEIKFLKDNDIEFDVQGE